MTVRTRFAPSPTGFMHVGNLRTALYAFLFARKQKGTFILRIEDTDQVRFIESAVEKIYSSLRTAGINWDEGPDCGGEFGPYVQSERKDMYLPYAKALVESGKAYYCFCTKEELDAKREAAEVSGESYKYDKHCLKLSEKEIEQKLASGAPYVIRQNIPLEGVAAFDDALYGRIEVDCFDLDDSVLIKADGMPTYNFANVVDDHAMQITHIIRGNEFLSSTPKYSLLYEAFGWKAPLYIHLTPVMKDSTRKLSKRHGDPGFEDLLEMGYLAEAIINYVALVGWSPGDDREFFTMDELIEAFSIDGLSKSPAIFDTNKLRWMNAEYIRRLAPDQFAYHAMPYLRAAGVEHMDIGILTKILQPRTEVLTDIKEIVGFLAAMDEGYELELFTNKKSKCDPEVALRVLNDVVLKLDSLNEWSEPAIHDLLIGMATDMGLKNGTLLWPVRIALSGKTVTPGGAIEIAALLGKTEAMRRLRLGINRLTAL